MRRAAGSLVLLLALTRPAFAQEETSARVTPPPASFDYLQYGVAFTAETVASAGDLCPSNAKSPCILGSGGGLEVHVGYRSRGPWYVGGAYESSRQDSSNLLRLAILQQLRAESRYYLDEGNRLTPYGTAGIGAALYGNEWGSETGGLMTFLGAGLEFQLSRTTVVGAAASYKPFLFRGWTDSAGQRRADRYLGFGVSHLVALSLVLEVRDPLPRW